MNESRPTIDEIMAQAAWMRRLAVRLVSDAAERDDLVQEAWLRALEGDAPRSAPLGPWLFGVMRNVARMELRTRIRRRRREEAAGAGEAAGGAAATATERADALVERVEMERQVAETLLTLDEPYRSTLLLRYYEDLEPTEIGKRLGIPAGTVRWRLKHGLAELRARLDARYGGQRRRWALALVPTAAAARGSLGAAIPLALGGVLIMKLGTKIVVAAAIVLVVAFAGTRLARRAPAAGVDGARPGVAWRVPGGIGATGSAPPTVAGVKIPLWFGQRGAPVRRIAGRVTFAGAPVEGATVELGSALSDAGVLAPAVQRTGKDGRFDFGVQPPEAYTVAASERAHSPAVLAVDARNPSLATEKLELGLGGCEAALFGHVDDASGGPVAGARLCYSPPRALACVTSDDGGAYELCVGPRQIAVTVAAKGYGAVNETVRHGGRRVQRDFLLTPEATLAGRVVRADDGTPVPGAWVRSLPGDAMSQRLAAPTGTTSDAQGRFTLAGLAPGRQRLIAGSEGLLSGEVVEVNVTAGRSTDGVILRVRAGSRVSGVVTDGRDPIGGATVRLADRWLGSDAVTQPDGSFTLENVPRGNNAFTVTPYQVEEPKTLVADRPERSGVRIRVTALGMISGRVTRGGKPVAGAEVNNMGIGETVLTDESGSYQLRGLHAAHYQIGAADAGAGAFGMAPAVELGAGEQRTGVDVDIKYGGSISGTVVEADGKPAAGLYVRFQATTIDDGGDDTTATDGSFRTATLMGGADYVPVVMPAQRTHQRFAPADGAFAPVHLTDGNSHVDGVRLVIKREHLKITGRTVDGDGAPLSDVRVNALHDGEVVSGDGFYDHASAISAADGSFTLPDLDAGSYDVEARAGDGSEGVAKNIAAGSGGVVVKLVATGGIDGTLVGYAVPPSVVAARLVDGNWVSRSFASVTGNGFTLRGLPPGNYQVSALGTGGDAVALQLQSGKTSNVTLRNRGAGTLIARVTDWRTGAPVPGMRCFAGPFPADGQRPALDSSNGAYTDGDGRFTIDNVALGPIGVLCSATIDATSDGVASLTVSAGQPASCEIQVVVPSGAAPGSIGARLDRVAYVGGRFVAVAPGSAADKAGVRAGDAVATVDGRSVEKLTPVGVLFALMGRPYGATARLGLLRGGATIETSVVVGPPNRGR